MKADRAKPLRQRRNFVPPEALLKEAVELRVRIGHDFYRLGEVLLQIRESEAWKHYQGCTSFEGFLKSYKLAGRTTAYKLIAIVRSYPRATALKMGTEVAYGMIRFSTIVDELLNMGIDPKLIFGDLDPLALSARDLAAIIRRLKAMMDEEGTAAPPPPAKPPPPRVPKTPLARKVQSVTRKLGATRLITSSFVHEGEAWLKIKVPEAQWRFVSSA